MPRMSKVPEQIAADLAKIVRGDVFADIIHRAAYSTVFDMTRYMNRIISTGECGETVVCEPGLVLADLNDHLAKFGRKIGPDPSSANRATVGGAVANNSTGSHSLQYGYMGDYVQSIEAVLGDGTVAEFTNDVDPEKVENETVRSIARQCAEQISQNRQMIKKALPKTKRNRCGYNIGGVYHDGRIDLARLLAGSEGTLAVFTKITLNTVPLPVAKGLLQLEFDSLDKMAKSVPQIVAGGVTTCELMDKKLIDMAIESLPEYRDILPAGAAAVLLIEHVGDNSKQVREKLEATDLAVGAAASGRSVFLEADQQARIWKSRKDAGPLLYRERSRKHPAEFMEDVSVDNTDLAAYLAGLEEIGRKHGVQMWFFGHAGDGELHIRPNLDLGDPDDLRKMRNMADEVFELAWSLGGTISGEHANGLVRAAFVRRQYGNEYYKILCNYDEESQGRTTHSAREDQDGFAVRR